MPLSDDSVTMSEQLTANATDSDCREPLGRSRETCRGCVAPPRRPSPAPSHPVPSSSPGEFEASDILPLLFVYEGDKRNHMLSAFCNHFS